jgi:hypothetical protein
MNIAPTQHINLGLTPGKVVETNKTESSQMIILYTDSLVDRKVKHYSS